MDLLEDALPGGCHPGLADHASLLRPLLNERRPSRDHVVVPYFQQPLWAQRFEVEPGSETIVGDSVRTQLPKYPTPQTSKMGTLVLTLRKAAGTVPGVGPTQRLWWWVFTDKLGRSIAATQTWRNVRWEWGGLIPYPSGIPPYFVADDDDVLAGRA